MPPIRRARLRGGRPNSRKTAGNDRRRRRGHPGPPLPGARGRHPTGVPRCPGRARPLQLQITAASWTWSVFATAKRLVRRSGTGRAKGGAAANRQGCRGGQERLPSGCQVGGHDPAHAVQAKLLSVGGLAQAGPAPRKPASILASGRRPGRCLRVRGPSTTCCPPLPGGPSNPINVMPRDGHGPAPEDLNVREEIGARRRALAIEPRGSPHRGQCSSARGPGPPGGKRDPPPAPELPEREQ